MQDVVTSSGAPVKHDFLLEAPHLAVNYQPFRSMMEQEKLPQFESHSAFDLMGD